MKTTLLITVITSSIIGLLYISNAFADSVEPSYFVTDDGSEDLKISVKQGSITELPIHLKVLPKYESAYMNLSFSNDRISSSLPASENYQIHNTVPKIKTWVNPYYAEYRDGNTTANTVYITIDSDVKPGIYRVDIIGNGQIKEKNSDEYISVDGKTVGRITLNVIANDSKLTMSVGERAITMRSFCITGDGFDQTCSTGPIYEEYQITMSSTSKTNVTLSASEIPTGAWLKFIPDTLIVDQNNATAKMILAGFEMPFLSSQESIPLVINAKSQDGIATNFIPIIKINDISILKSAEPITLKGEITQNGNGTNFNTYGVVYAPVDLSKKSLDVRLEVLGLAKDSGIISIPLWLKTDIPVSSFTLNAAEPYYFVIQITTKSAPIGTYDIAIKEIVDGKEFVETVRINIQEPKFSGGLGMIISIDPVSADLTKISPLKQFKSGIHLNDIKCKESLTIVTKHGGSPACVKPETKIKLIERGWALNQRIPEQDQLEDKIITPKDSDKLINIKKGESFVVKLDDSYNWRMDIDNKTVVNSDYSDIRYSGSQGVYKANNSGQAILTGIGDPACLSSDPPCKSPSILFQLNINVK